MKVLSITIGVLTTSILCIAIIVIATASYYTKANTSAGDLLYAPLTNFRFPHYYNTPFEGRRVSSILILKGLPYDHFQSVDFEIKNKDIIRKLTQDLDKSKASYFPGMLGTLVPTQIYLDEKRNVIAAFYCRIPENRVCVINVLAANNGFILKDIVDSYGVYNKKYVQDVYNLIQARNKSQNQP